MNKIKQTNKQTKIHVSMHCGLINIAVWQAVLGAGREVVRAYVEGKWAEPVEDNSVGSPGEEDRHGRGTEHPHRQDARRHDGAEESSKTSKNRYIDHLPNRWNGIVVPCFTGKDSPVLMFSVHYLWSRVEAKSNMVERTTLKDRSAKMAMVCFSRGI